MPIMFNKDSIINYCIANMRNDCCDVVTAIITNLPKYLAEHDVPTIRLSDVDIVCGNLKGIPKHFVMCGGVYFEMEPNEWRYVPESVEKYIQYINFINGLSMSNNQTERFERFIEVYGNYFYDEVLKYSKSKGYSVLPESDVIMLFREYLEENHKTFLMCLETPEKLRSVVPNEYYYRCGTYFNEDTIFLYVCNDLLEFDDYYEFLLSKSIIRRVSTNKWFLESICKDNSDFTKVYGVKTVRKLLPYLPKGIQSVTTDDLLNALQTATRNPSKLFRTRYLFPCDFEGVDYKSITGIRGIRKGSLGGDGLYIEVSCGEWRKVFNSVNEFYGI